MLLDRTITALPLASPARAWPSDLTATERPRPSSRRFTALSPAPTAEASATTNSAVPDSTRAGTLAASSSSPSSGSSMHPAAIVASVSASVLTAILLAPTPAHCVICISRHPRDLRGSNVPADRGVASRAASDRNARRFAVCRQHRIGESYGPISKSARGEILSGGGVEEDFDTACRGGATQTSDRPPPEADRPSKTRG
jgi:hypothetical protein